MKAPPAEVTQALWRDIEVAELGELEAQARVSMLLDGDAGTGALAAQTYPAQLIDVPAGGEPEGDVVIVVPPGAVPAPEFAEAHARWHHVAGDVVSLGPVAPAHAEADAQLGLVRDLTRDLTDLGGGYHLAAADGTIAVSRELYDEAGGRGTAAPELWRLDLLYRLHCAGALFTVEPAARARGAPGGLARTVAQRGAVRHHAGARASRGRGARGAATVSRAGVGPPPCPPRDRREPACGRNDPGR